MVVMIRIGIKRKKAKRRPSVGRFGGVGRPAPNDAHNVRLTTAIDLVLGLLRASVSL